MSTNISKNYVNQSKAIFEISSVTHWASQMVLIVKNSAASAGDIRDAGLIPDWEDPMEKGMATHSSIAAWKIPWTE